jgi:hypothetical protein
VAEEGRGESEEAWLAGGEGAEGSGRQGAHGQQESALTVAFEVNLNVSPGHGVASSPWWRFGSKVREGERGPKLTRGTIQTNAADGSVDCSTSGGTTTRWRSAQTKHRAPFSTDSVCKTWASAMLHSASS